MSQQLASISSDTPSQFQVEQVAREHGLRTFLLNAKRSGEISSRIADIAWDTWTQLKAKAIKSLLVPDASGGPDEGVLYFWDRGEHHLELEILGNGTIEIFYRNRQTGELYGLFDLLRQQPGRTRPSDDESQAEGFGWLPQSSRSGSVLSYSWLHLDVA